MNCMSKQYVMGYTCQKTRILYNGKYNDYKYSILNLSLKNYLYYRRNCFDIPVSINVNGAKTFGQKRMHHRLIGPAYIDTSKNIMLYYINREFDLIQSVLRENSFKKNIIII